MYNILDESWISIKRLDGTEDLCSVRYALKNADTIKEIIPPTFHGSKVYVYEYLIVRLLTTLIESSYYKAETNFAAKNLRYLDELREDGLYTKTVEEYLDRFYDRFDLESETHPFLQNIKLKEEFGLVKPEVQDYLTWNPIAPGANNKVFGNIRRSDPTAKSILDQYKMTRTEYLYTLLYLIVMGNTPAATVSLEGSLNRDAGMFVMLKGKTLKDTILANILPLKESSRPSEGNPDEKADMPLWEMDNIYEMNEYPMETIGKNLLCRMFYPGISLLNMGFDDEGYINGIVRCRYKDESKNKKKPKKEAPKRLEGLNADNTKMLLTMYKDPYIVTGFDVKEKDKAVKLAARTFNLKTYSAPALILIATKKVEKYDSCPVLNNLRREDVKDVSVNVFYREMDVMKITLLSMGEIENKNTKTWICLGNEENHRIAEEYQDFYKVLRGLLYAKLRILYDKPEEKEEGISYRKLSKNNFNLLPIDNAKQELSDFMEDDFFGAFTDGLSDNEADKKDVFANSRIRICDKVLEIFDKYADRTKDYILTIKVRRDLVSRLYKLKQGNNIKK